MESKPMSASGRVVTRQDNTKFGIWIFLGGEIIFFSTLIVTYVYFRLVSPTEYLQFRQNLNIPLVGVNTFILIASSYMVVRALEGAQANNAAHLQRNLIAVIILGAVFIGGQAFEWITLFNHGIGVDNQFGTPFYTITGIHGTHVLIGIIWAIILLALNLRRPHDDLRRSPMEIFGLYWHFVDIVWIFLFTLFYLI
jgi:heme/copper-type cytochrome/quinol oxidase subunit 3